MGLIICEKHGWCGIDFTSPLIAESITRGEVLSKEQLSKISIIFGDIEFVYIFDNQHLEKLGLLSLDSYTIETDEQFSKLETKPICGKCYQEYLENIGFESIT